MRRQARGGRGFAPVSPSAAAVPAYRNERALLGEAGAVLRQARETQCLDAAEASRWADRLRREYGDSHLRREAEEMAASLADAVDLHSRLQEERERLLDRRRQMGYERLWALDAALAAKIPHHLPEDGGPAVASPGAAASIPLTDAGWPAADADLLAWARAKVGIDRPQGVLANFTPHRVDVIRPDGSVLSIDPAPCGPARVEARPEPTGICVAGIPVMRTTYGEVRGLPAPQEGQWLIVSLLVLAACPERDDLLAPGELVRHPDGTVSGCRGLTR